MDSKRKARPDGGAFGLIFLLGVVLLITFAIGNGTNSAAAVAAAVFFVGAVVMYFAPAVVASVYGHPSATAIGVLNFFLGWTVIGWVASLVWAFNFPKPDPSQATAADEGMRACPYCAEPIRVEAIKCKHCASDLAQSPAA